MYFYNGVVKIEGLLSFEAKYVFVLIILDH